MRRYRDPESLESTWASLDSGETYVLYTKQGYESMACVKSAEQFEKECTLGSPMAAEHEGAKSSSSAPRELTA